MSLYKGVNWNEPIAIVGTAIPKLQAEVVTGEPAAATPGLLVYTALGYADNPIRIDPTGTTTQPVTIVGGGGGTSQFAMGSVQASNALGTIALGYDGTHVYAIPMASLGASVIVSGTITPAKTSQSPSAPTQATVGASSALALASNSSRTGLVLVNTSANTISIAFGANAAVLNSGMTLNPNGGTFVMDAFTFTTQAVNAIAGAASSNLSIQELA